MSGIKGDIKFSKFHEGGPTHVTVNLNGINETLKWAIQRLPMFYKGNAAMSCHADAVGGLYDPKMALESSNYSTSCGPSSESRFDKCAVGDLTGMLGNLDASNSHENFTHQKLMIPITLSLIHI